MNVYRQDTNPSLENMTEIFENQEMPEEEISSHSDVDSDYSSWPSDIELPDFPDVNVFSVRITKNDKKNIGKFFKSNREKILNADWFKIKINAGGSKASLKYLKLLKSKGPKIISALFLWWHKWEECSIGSYFKKIKSLLPRIKNWLFLQGFFIPSEKLKELLFRSSHLECLELRYCEMKWGTIQVIQTEEYEEKNYVRLIGKKDKLNSSQKAQVRGLNEIILESSRVLHEIPVYVPGLCQVLSARFKYIEDSGKGLIVEIKEIFETDIEEGFYSSYFSYYGDRFAYEWISNS